MRDGGEKVCAWLSAEEEKWSPVTFFRKSSLWRWHSVTTHQVPNQVWPHGRVCVASDRWSVYSHLYWNQLDGHSAPVRQCRLYLSPKKRERCNLLSPAPSSHGTDVGFVFLPWCVSTGACRLNMTSLYWLNCLKKKTPQQSVFEFLAIACCFCLLLWASDIMATAGT